MTYQDLCHAIFASVGSVLLSLNFIFFEQGFPRYVSKDVFKRYGGLSLIRRLSACGHPERRVRDNAPYLAPSFRHPCHHSPEAAAVSASSRSRACRETTPLPGARRARSPALQVIAGRQVTQTFLSVCGCVEPSAGMPVTRLKSPAAAPSHPWFDCTVSFKMSVSTRAAYRTMRRSRSPFILRKGPFIQIAEASARLWVTQSGSCKWPHPPQRILRPGLLLSREIWFNQPH
jgi:hypothetical protein